MEETAFITAVIRADENRRTDRYLIDPFADHLVTPRARFAAARALEAGGTTGSVILRGRFGDQVLRDAVDSGITQVVVLGAGSDTRCWRLPLVSAVQVYEVDLPGQLEAKERLLSGLPRPTCRRTLLDCDLRSPGWTSALAGRGHHRGRRTLWVVEGLLPYLSPEESDRLLAEVSAVSAADSVITLDAPDARYLAEPANAGFLTYMERAGSPFLHGVQDMASYLGAFGWRAAAYSVADLGEGRCTGMPRPPRRLCAPRDHHWIARAQI
ncbi:class I SAM-dependent methyltransferase [Streptomyces sp. NPDC058701]|uniref:class I SAM-dependent methyltransferase n=1 Tax=Streptomyces sp. NPDC058701 TaxID=3346608 RepID=UPI003664D481